MKLFGAQNPEYDSICVDINGLNVTSFRHCQIFYFHIQGQPLGQTRWDCLLKTDTLLAVFPASRYELHSKLFNLTEEKVSILK